MKNRYVVLAMLIIPLYVSAQDDRKSKLVLIQGIWENSSNSDKQHSFKIVKGKNSIGISHPNAPNNLDFYINESVLGFQDFKYEEADSINVGTFKEDGKYFTSVIYKDQIHRNGWVRIEYCIVAEYFECNGENMSINGGQLVEFAKIDRLPNLTIRLLYDRGKRDKRNYIKDYIGIDVREVKEGNSPVYSKPGVVSQISLAQGDLVTIIEKKGEWCKIEFETGEVIEEGWVKKKGLK